MGRKYTEYDITMAICFQTMLAHQFRYSQRKEWTTWAAHHQICSECLSPPGQPCLNLQDIKKQKPEPRVNTNPHDSRVDFNRMLQGLKRRGYYRPAIEQGVRNWAKFNTDEPFTEPEEDPGPMPDWAR